MRSFCIAFHKICFRKDFLASLQLEEQALAPLTLEKLEIQQVTLHIGHKWRAVLVIDNVVVDGTVSDPKSDVYGLKQAIEQKIKEAAHWTKRLEQAKQNKSSASTTTTTTTTSSNSSNSSSRSGSSGCSSFKDRILHSLVEQIDVRLLHVEVNLDAQPSTLFVSSNKTFSPTQTQTQSGYKQQHT